MLRKTILISVLAAAPALASDAPYAGQDNRDIAALSAADIDDLLAGRGWGFALPAELNGYPGPTHVLEAAEALRITPEQRSAVEDIFARMNARARALGAEYVEAEAALDAAFGDGSITPETLTALTGEAARLRSELRAAHLAAHLETAPILTRHQVVTYNRLRGYGNASGEGAHDGGGAGHGKH